MSLSRRRHHDYQRPASSSGKRILLYPEGALSGELSKVHPPGKQGRPRPGDGEVETGMMSAPGEVGVVVAWKSLEFFHQEGFQEK